MQRRESTLQGIRIGRFEWSSGVGGRVASVCRNACGSVCSLAWGARSRAEMGRVFAMTTKLLGVGSVSDDSIGLLGDALEELDQEVGERELLEFLAADLDPVPADPVFQRQLGDLLWEMVCQSGAGRRRDH
jgi:hypothetical protein